MRNVDPPIALRDAYGAGALIVPAYEAHHAELFAFLARSTRDRAVAEDLLRETFLRLTRATRDERAPDQVRGTLYRIASNLVVERAHRQSAAKRRRIAAPAPEPRLLMTERSTDIERALEGLSVDARVGLLLSGEGFSGDDIAAAIGQSAAATRNLLCLARRRVRVRRELFAAEGR
jgi:RNA polymerase sigma factor (sigma-70 family)